MAFLIRQIERSASGREIRRERTLPGPQLKIGRAAGNELALPDLALDAVHATIDQITPGRIRIEAASTLGFTLDGAHRRSAEVACRNGAELGFGSYRLTVSETGDGGCAIEVRRAEGEDPLEARRGFSLAGLLPGKRSMAWIAGLGILIAFLLTPIVTHKLNERDKSRAVIGDASWRPGKLSLAHHALERSCETCHVKGFVAVRDETCRACHKDVHDHTAADRMARARAEPGWGGRLLNAVAASFNRPGPGACVDCHLEHQGATAMAPPAQKFCADCHGTLTTRLKDTRLGDAGDFGRVHPQFRPAIVVDAAARRLARVTLGTPPREDNGLTFSHKAHLDPRGGAARMAISLGAARGYGRGLDCASCHRLTEDRTRYLPITMERDCAACHSLAYDRIGGTVRRLRHGDIAQAIADLAVSPGAASGPTGAILEGRRRPGEFATGGLYYNRFSNPPVGAGAAGLAFGRGGICSECHTPVMRGGSFGVMPVTLLGRYMDKAAFDHRAHRQTACKECHAAAGSTRASDVLLPGLATCRTCHLGEDSTKAKVPSGCAMCHSYHPPTFARRRKDEEGS